MELHLQKKPSQYAPLALAYIGDGVYEVFIRSRMMELHPDLPAHKLHLQTVRYVKAHAQAKSMHALQEFLTEQETAVYKRGRNAKSATVPKNADLSEYRQATGFEALIGYLYLNGETQRLEQLMELAFEAGE
jgi:ribonuclease-3 family protein